jgi:putative ABC transport system permease protein
MIKIASVFRSIKKNCLLTVINISCMALGLVSAGIIVSYIYQEYRYDYDTQNAERIFRVIQKEGESLNTVTFGPLAESLEANYPEIEEASRVSFFYGYLSCIAGKNSSNERSAIFADPEFFDFFAFPLIRGKSSECLVSPYSVVLSQRAAKKYFGEQDPMGKVLRIGQDNEYTVTGVFHDFKSNSNFAGDLVLPLKQVSKLTQIWIEPSWEYESDIHTFILLTENSAIDDLSGKAEHFIDRYIPGKKIDLVFQSMGNIHVTSDLTWEPKASANVSYLKILLIVALLTLGISMVNFLFLYTGTAALRIRGTGIKKVYGASKRVLFMEHYREVILLVLLSTLSAILLFALYQYLLAPHFSFLPLIVLFNFKLILLLSLLVILVAILSGIYPALVLSSQKPVRLLNNKTSSKKGEMKMVHLLVIAQFTLCITLTVATFVMHRQTRHMLNQDTGYARDELITIPLNMHLDEGINGEKFELFARELKKYPGIKNATLSSSSPSLAFSSGDDPVNWDGKPEGKNVYMNWESISYDYFQTLGVNINQGRVFSREFPNDRVNWETRQCAYIVNESAVKELGFTDPLGREIEVWGFHGPIVGVVGDYNFRSLHSGIGPVFYQFNPFFWSEIIVRIDPADPSTRSDIEQVWNEFVSDYPLEMSFVNDQIHDLYRDDRNLANAMNVFSLLAIVIASMGMFTLTLLSMNSRIREIGLRKVNGASIRNILFMLIRDYIKRVALAFVIAVPLAWYSMHLWLENFAYKTSLSWWIFVLCGLLVLGIAILTVSWLSWQAAARNPIVALRHE